MEESVTIVSARDATRLTFSGVAGEIFTAAVQGDSFTGRLKVSTYHYGPPSPLFAEMADAWRGWEGTKEWTALEGELCLKASHDRLGHINLEVRMRSGHPADWQLETSLELQAGQLEALSRDVGKLFSNVTSS